MASALGTFIPSLAFLDNIVQDRTLEKEFLDSLYPATLYRAQAPQEEWAARAGDTLTQTRAANLPDVVDPLSPGVDPQPVQPEYEQWSVVCTPFGNMLPVDMRGDFMAIANTVLRNMKTMGLNAGASIDRLARNKMFKAYLSGEAMTTAGATSASVPVTSINGFTHVMWNGSAAGPGVLTPVSAQTPLAITIAGVAHLVTAATPASQLDPTGPGTLTLSASTTYTAHSVVRATNAPTIIRPSGGSIDSITPASALTFKQCRDAKAKMALNGVMPMGDGSYHLHLDPRQVSQLRGDNEWQRSIEANPRDPGWVEGVLGRFGGITYIENPRAPSPTSSGTLAASRTTGSYSSQLKAEVRNLQGTGILRGIMMGGGVIQEKYVNELAAYATAAGNIGKVGMFQVLSNNGIAINLEKIRFIMQAPLDVMQTIMKMAWSWAGDFAVPSDAGGGQPDDTNKQLFKRAIVLESGTAD